jgi:3-deoxy-manno-octulosonate cytidylyltransferase (CMP-KDO synthetase)
MRAIGVIPARFGSTRFPGKPLALLFGKPMILHTYEAALRADSLSRVVVATDDDRILKVVRDIGGEAMMTAPECDTGTDRVREAVSSIEASPGVLPFDIVVNIQGDEPLVNPTHIDSLVHSLEDDPSAMMSTLTTPIHTKEEALDPNVVKCVVDNQL